MIKIILHTRPLGSLRIVGMAGLFGILCSFNAWAFSNDVDSGLFEKSRASKIWPSIRCCYSDHSLESLVKEGENGIDIAMASLLLAKRFDPKVDLEENLEQVDRFTQDILESLPDKIPLEDALNLLITSISREYFPTGRGYDVDPAQGFLSTVLKTGQGNCLGLSTLYLAVGRRIGLPLYMVEVPGHIFVRFISSNRTINIETLEKGERWEDETYLESTLPGQCSAFMHVLSPREELAVLTSNLGCAWAGRGNPKYAAAAWRWAVRLNPQDAIIHNNLGNSLLLLGEYEKALSSYGDALTLDSTFGRAFFNRALALCSLMDFGGAIKDFDRAIELNPNDAVAYNNRGAAKLELENYGEALEDFDSAIRLKPDYLKAYLNRAEAWQRLGKAENSMRDRQAAEDLGRGILPELANPSIFLSEAGTNTRG